MMLAGMGLAACGGSDMPGPAADLPEPGPQGFYTGRLVSQSSGYSLSAFAVVADDGHVRIVEPALRRQFVASLPAQGSDWQGALTGYAGPLADFPNGAAGCSGSVQASAFAAAELIGTYDCGGDQGSFDLSYDDKVSFDPQDVGLLTGVAEFDLTPGDIVVLNIAPDGSFSGSDTGGCTYAGNFRVADPLVDIYTLGLVRDCAGSKTSFTGLATLATDSVSGNPALYFGASGSGDSLAGLLVFQ